jgi:glutathione S-transferase
MSDPIVYGFPRSTFVNIVRTILTHKGVAYSFHDLEPVMGEPDHLALHPFNRVPILRHGDLTIYETSAIAVYVDEAFDGARLTPKDVKTRARMNQWVSAVNSYYYPYMIYHVTHERLVFPELGIASDEKVVAHAHGKNFLLGDELTIADFYLLPSTFAFSLTAEGQSLYPKFPAFCRWRERMDNLPATQKVRAAVPRVPIQHAREWANSHRPKY